MKNIFNISQLNINIFFQESLLSPINNQTYNTKKKNYFIFFFNITTSPTLILKFHFCIVIHLQMRFKLDLLH